MSNSVPATDAVAVLEKAIAEDQIQTPRAEEAVIANKPLEVIMPSISNLHSSSPTESPIPTPRPESTALPPGTEWKALTIYDTLLEHDETQEAHHHQQLNSHRFSQELSKQILVKKAQLDRERDDESRYFSEVILKDVQNYRRECKEKEAKKRSANEEYLHLLLAQKQFDMTRRELSEREAERVEVKRQRERFERDEKERKEKKKLQQLSYRSELLKQIKERQSLCEPDTVMTPTERSLNRSQLERLKDDPEKYAKVKKMLILSPCVSPPSSAVPSSLSSSPVKRGRRLKGHEGIE
jgi:hypothetical protein